jgi:hypothetical protein
VYGCRSEVPSALRVTPTVKYNYGNFLTELRGTLQSANEDARDNLISSKKDKEYYNKDSETFEMKTGQKIFVLMRLYVGRI